MHLFPFIDFEWVKQADSVYIDPSNLLYSKSSTHQLKPTNELAIQLAIELKNLYIYAACIKTAVAKTYNDYHLKMLYHHNFMNLNDSVFVAFAVVVVLFCLMCVLLSLRLFYLSLSLPLYLSQYSLHHSILPLNKVCASSATS